MSGKKQLNVRINKQLKEEFISYVIEIEGSKSHYMGKHVENALREYLNNDRLARVEADIDEIRRLLEMGGGPPSQTKASERKNKSATTEQTTSSETYDPDTYSGTLSESELRDFMELRDDPDLEIDPEHVDPTTLWNNTDLYIGICRGILRYAHADGPSAIVPRKVAEDVVKEYCGSTEHYVDTYVPQVLDGFYKLSVGGVDGRTIYSATTEGFANLVQTRIHKFETLIKRDVVSHPDPENETESIQENYDVLMDLEGPAKRASVEGTYRRVIEETDQIINDWEAQSLTAEKVRKMVDELVNDGELLESKAEEILNKWENANFSARELASEKELEEYYKKLGLTPDASDDEVRARHQSLALEHHPDQSDRADAEERMKEITAARDTILE